MVEITQDPIHPQICIDRVRKHSHGAVVTFVGSVRDLSAAGTKALYLENDVSAGDLAQRELQRIADEVGAKWQLDDVAICHRLGRLSVGEITLVVAVAAPHRQEAFEACQYAIDRFKKVVPQWEKEVLEDEPA